MPSTHRLQRQTSPTDSPTDIPQPALLNTTKTMANLGNNIEVDPDMIDPSDTDYASSGYDTSSTSLSSTVNDYIFENGRRYHAYYGTDKNLLPTDEEEQDRMDLNHEILIGLLQRELHKSPIGKNPQRILDVGTGTGIWAVDMADRYPSAEVLGIDLSPIQPGWVPPNCKFEVDDAELPWTYPSGVFDLIHFRHVAQGITKWPEVLTEAYRCMKPGSYIELVEYGIHPRCDDGTLTPDNALVRFGVSMEDAMRKSGRVGPSEEQLKTRLENAGFVDVQTFILKQPLGPWAKAKYLKKVGLMSMLVGEQSFHSYGLLAFTKILGMDQQEAEKLCRDAVAATKNKSVHSYYSLYIVIGRKPED